MRKYVFALIFSFVGVVYAKPGPIYEHKDSNVQREFIELYKATRDVLNSSGTISNSLLDSSSVTKQGNTFNGANQLVQTNSSSLIANSNLDSSSVTKQGNTFNGANQLLQADSSGLIANADVNASSITKQGNTFNGANQLIQADASGLVNNSDLDTSSVTKLGNGNIAFQGRTTNNNQPSFLAYNSATDNDVTGNGVQYVMVFNTEVYDTTSAYDGVSTFTAIVGGRYQLGTCLQLQNLQTTSHPRGVLLIMTSNRNYSYKMWEAGSSPNSIQSFCMEVIADMDAADTAYVKVIVDSGSQDVDVTGQETTSPGSITAIPTYFYGTLFN